MICLLKVYYPINFIRTSYMTSINYYSPYLVKLKKNPGGFSMRKRTGVTKQTNIYDYTVPVCFRIFNVRNSNKIN